MTGPERLQAQAGRLKTRMGAAFPGSRAVFRGHDLHAELKDMDWPELYVFGITGRRFTPGQVRLLHAIWTYTSYPDARLWNNRVAALAGSARSTGNLALAAALAASEASIFGRGIDLRAATFFTRAAAALAQGATLESEVRAELARHRGIAGYGRPIAAGDERLAPILDLARTLGLDRGEHLRIARAVEEFLLAGRWRWRMNYGAVAAALVLDLGLSPREYYLFMFPAFLAGMPPCFLEAAEQAEGLTFPLACTTIDYVGVPGRRWRSEPDRAE